jgi:hypothetical protein
VSTKSTRFKVDPLRWAWRIQTTAACERPFSALFVPPRLLGASPAALVGSKNPSKTASSQVLRSFNGADFWRDKENAAGNTFLYFQGV